MIVPLSPTGRQDTVINNACDFFLYILNLFLHRKPLFIWENLVANPEPEMIIRLIQEILVYIHLILILILK